METISPTPALEYTAQPVVALKELGVTVPWRKTGTSRRLHDALLAAYSAKPYVSLMVNPAAGGKGPAALRVVGLLGIGVSHPAPHSPILTAMIRPASGMQWHLTERITLGAGSSACAWSTNRPPRARSSSLPARPATLLWERTSATSPGEAERLRPPQNDSWLLDSRVLARFAFDEDDTTLGVYVTEDPPRCSAPARPGTSPGITPSAPKSSQSGYVSPASHPRKDSSPLRGPPVPTTTPTTGATTLTTDPTTAGHSVAQPSGRNTQLRNACATSKQASPDEAAAPMAAGARLEAMRRHARLAHVAVWTIIAAGPIALAVAVATTPDHGRSGPRYDADRRAHRIRSRPERLCATVHRCVVAQQRGRPDDCAGAACAVDGAGRRTARPGLRCAIGPAGIDRPLTGGHHAH